MTAENWDDSQLDSSNQSLDDALEAQQMLAESSLESVFETYDEALSEGVRHPVIMLIDCEDELGAQISRAWLGDDAVDEAIALQAEEADERASEAGTGNDDESPTTVFVAAFAYEDCRKEAIKAFPYLEEALSAPPGRDGVFIISVTSGGASALTAPLDARP